MGNIAVWFSNGAASADGANVRLADIDIDWTQVGVSRKSVETWWTAHKKEDEARRAREEALKAAALAKLTDDEKKALGL